MIITTNNPELAKRQIQSAKKPIVIQAQNEEFNRKMLEYGKFDILLSVESTKKPDTLRQLNSGLNEIIARIAAKNKVALGIDLSELKSLTKQQKAQRLARIRQNIRICRKANATIQFYTHSDKNLSKSLLISLGASSAQAKQAISF